MTLETVYCAICREQIALDSDHVEIAAEHVHTGDRNTQDDFMFHIDCWMSISDGWMAPA